MSKYLSVLLGSALLIGCEAKTEDPEIIIAYDDYEDWQDWKRETEEDAKKEGFLPQPIYVSGVGKARGKPDIAVLTGLIKVEADFDHLAMDKAGEIMNKVQDSVRGADVELSFTQVSTSEIRDPKCLEANRYARQRHRDIMADNQFNTWLKRQPKENRQELRKPKARIKESTCPVTHVEGFVRFTAWVQPVDSAGDYINAFANAGVAEVDLFGYDFTNYDELYQNAARDAVNNAKAKAKLAAKTAGTQLTTLEQFSVGPTQRTTRYGQQAMIISNHGNRRVAQRKYSGTQDNVIVSGRRTRFNTRGNNASAMTCWDGSYVSNRSQCPAQPSPSPPSGDFAQGQSYSTGYGAQSQAYSDTVVIQPATVEYVTIPATYETVTETVVVQEASTELVSVPTVFETVYENGIARRVVKTPARTVERAIPAVTKQVTRRVIKTPASTIERTVPAVTQQVSSVPKNNALRMSLMSGNQTITVRAQMAFSYNTPLNGKIIVENER